MSEIGLKLGLVGLDRKEKSMERYCFAGATSLDLPGGRSKGRVRPNFKSRGLLTALAMLLLPPAVVGQTSWKIQELLPLPSGPGDQTQATGINNSGVIVGESGDLSSASNRLLVVWRNGVSSTLSLPPGKRYLSLSPAPKINDRGQIVANVQDTGGGPSLAVRWTNNIPSILSTVLPPPNGNQTAGYGINVAGDIAGAIPTYVKVGSQGGVAATVWRDNTGSMLDGQPGQLGKAINSNGVVAGVATTFFTWPTPNRAYAALWFGSSQTALSELPGTTGSSAEAINDAGVVVGFNSFLSTTVPVRWINGQPIQLPALTNQGFATAQAINAVGDIVGAGTRAGGGATVPIIWRAGVPTDLFAASGAASQGWQYGLAYAVNDLGQIVGSGIRNGKTRGFILSPAIELVDIMSSDSEALLLNAGNITTDVERLATGGRVILGAAADGSTIAVLRIPATQVGQVFTVDVSPNQCATTGSRCVDSYGRLFVIAGTQATSIYSNAGAPGPVQVTAQATSRGPMAFVGYRSPSDFIRVDSDSNAEADRAAPSRILRLQFTSQTSQEAVIQVARPPVILVHGLWADSSGMGDLDQLGKTYGQLFRTSFATYGDANYWVDLTRTTPRSTTEYHSGSSLGYAHGASALLQKMIEEHVQVRSGANSAGVPIASTQYDVVGHSMGNLVTRTMVTLMARAGSAIRKPPVLRDRGYVHKLISIGGPHLGSPLAQELAAESNSCIRNILATAVGGIFGDCPTCVSAYASSDDMRAGRNPVYVGSGAIGDLSGSTDMTTLSRALTDLRDNGKKIPTAYVSGVMSDVQIDTFLGPTPSRRICQPVIPFACIDIPSPINLIQLLRTCPGNLSEKVASPAAFRQLMSPKTDGVVSLKSQLNDMAGRPGYPVPPTSGVFHSPGAALLFKKFFTEEPTELTPAGVFPPWSVLEAVRGLLNTPASNPSVFVQ